MKTIPGHDSWEILSYKSENIKSKDEYLIVKVPDGGES